MNNFEDELEHDDTPEDTGFETVEYTVLACLLPELFNGEASEEAQDADGVAVLERWARTRDCPAGMQFSHWSLKEGESEEFDLCEATDLRGSTEVVQAVYFPLEAVPA